MHALGTIVAGQSSLSFDLLRQLIGIEVLSWTLGTMQRLTCSLALVLWCGRFLDKSLGAVWPHVFLVRADLSLELGVWVYHLCSVPQGNLGWLLASWLHWVLANMDGSWHYVGQWLSVHRLTTCSSWFIPGLLDQVLSCVPDVLGLHVKVEFDCVILVEIWKVCDRVLGAIWPLKVHGLQKVVASRHIIDVPDWRGLWVFAWEWESLLYIIWVLSRARLASWVTVAPWSRPYPVLLTTVVWWIEKSLFISIE